MRSVNGDINSLLKTLLTILWVYAAGSKLMEYATFTAQLGRQPLPTWSIGILAWLLPLVEITAAIMICIRRVSGAGLYLSVFLLAVFTLYIVFALSGTFGNIPCSCMGIIETFTWKEHLIFNTGFMLVNVLSIYLDKRGNSYDGKMNAITS